MEELIEQVREWARSKGIYDKSTADHQKLLCYAEIGELADELAKENYDAAEMELGDVIVTLINYCEMSGSALIVGDFCGAMHRPTELNLLEYLTYEVMEEDDPEKYIAIIANRIGTTPEKALKRALDKITKRTGKMVGGKFVKDA